MDPQFTKQKFCDYSNYIKGNSPRTIDRYHVVLDFFFRDQSIHSLEEISKENVFAFFYNGRTKRGWSPATFISYYNTLSIFFQYCVKEKLMGEDYTSELEKPRLSKRIPNKLTKEQALQLLEYVYNYPYQSDFVRNRNHAIFSTFIFTGVRRRELLNLKYADIDLIGMSLMVRQGKGNKDRIIPLSHQLAEVLNDYIIQRKRLHRTCPEFFTSVNGNRGFSPQGLKHVVDKIKKSSGIKFGLHQLRHTFATLMLEGGCDIYALSKMMGHSDIKTTTIYLAASTKHLKEQMFKHPLNNSRLK